MNELYQEHFKSCGYYQNIDRATKLAEQEHMIKGTSAGIAPETKSTSGAGNFNDNLRKPDHLERRFKPKEHEKMIKGL
ncbi:MAG: hypothetical protein ACRD42_00260 [Nitrososphaeraceae archaeon]